MQEEFSGISEHEALEADIKQLAQEIMRERERPENAGVSDKDLLKKSLKQLTSDTGQKTETKEAPPEPLPHYAEEMSPETKLEVEYLLDMAFHEGIEKANTAAKKSNPFVIDTFHDSLAGKLYPELKKRGLLK